MMTSKNVETVTNLLTKLHGYAYFRPQDGALRERLSQAILDAMDAEALENLPEEALELEVSIGRQEGDDEIIVTFRVENPGVERSSQLALHLLKEDELADLVRYLEPMAEKAPTAEEAAAGKNIVRKQVDDNDHHEIGPTAARLKVSPEWLKSVVPCTDYSYEEIDGRKYIREYYWSKELVERLFKIKSTKTTPEDLQYVAKECCDGDPDWARDLIARLKSPNRPEPAPRDQSQRGQGRGPQVKTAQARPQQGRPGQQRPAQGNAAPAKAAPEKSAPGNAAPGNAAPEKAPQANAGQRPAGQQGEGQRERSRSRSRHRKPFRQQGKDGSGKPDPSGGQKQPQ